MKKEHKVLRLMSESIQITEKILRIMHKMANLNNSGLGHTKEYKVLEKKVLRLKKKTGLIEKKLQNAEKEI